MEALITYLLKSVLYSALFLSIYWCFLKNETFYRFNRYFLLSGLLCSMALPLYTYTYRVNIVASTVVEGQSKLSGIASSHGAIWVYALVFVYAVGALVLLSRHVAGLSRIKRMISKYGYTRVQGYKLVRTSVFKSSFSVFNYIILDNSSERSEVERKLIIEHEMAHIKQSHWFDLMISQLFCALQWFNPLAWIYLSAVKQNHEFLADQAVLDQGNSAAVYRAALINHSLGTTVFSLASSFSQHNQLKRIHMMMKPASLSFKKAVVLLLFPVLALSIWAFKKPEFIILPAAVEVSHEPLVPERRPVTITTHEQKQPKKAAIPHSADSMAAQEDVLPKYAKVSINYKPDMKTKSGVFPSDKQPLVYLDGVEISSIHDVDNNNVASVSVIKDVIAVQQYGERGKNGVVLISSKTPQFIPQED